MGEALSCTRLRGAWRRRGREDGGSPLDRRRGSARTGLPWAKRWGRPFANRASTRPPLPLIGRVASSLCKHRAENPHGAASGH